MNIPKQKDLEKLIEVCWLAASNAKMEGIQNVMMVPDHPGAMVTARWVTYQSLIASLVPKNVLSNGRLDVTGPRESWQVNEDEE